MNELRQALDMYAISLPDMPGQLLVNEESWAFCRVAARRWLSLLEADEAVVRRIAEVLDHWAPDLNDYAIERFTAELLAAIVGEET